MAAEKLQKELTLDPENWAEFRALGHRMLDDMLEHLSTLATKPAWQPIPPGIREALSEPVPYQGQGADQVYEEFLHNVLPYPNGNLHPRYWGWVQGTGVPLAMLADMVASGMNAHLAGFNQAPVLVEKQVVEWLKELLGFPSSASGVLVSGGTMANITALAVARNAKAGYDVKEQGLSGRPDTYLVFYGSLETHSWASKAAGLLGLGTRSFRQIAINGDFTINVEELERRIVEDRRNGLTPFCVIGTAGTVNTGATDDLEALAAVCRRQRLWFHVDGAFGALARLVPELRQQVKGLELADSLAFDLHKWMYLPFEIACVLVKDSETHRSTFSQSGSYLNGSSRGVIAGGLPFAELGFELTRNFKALKAWMTFKAYGIETFADLIKQNVEQASYLKELLENNDELELLAPVPLNVVCFRFRGTARDNAQLNAINEEILLQLQEQGIAVPSSTEINGAFALRVAIVNHRSSRKDFDLLVQSVLDKGRQLL